jgi:hypothetical protein
MFGAGGSVHGVRCDLWEVDRYVSAGAVVVCQGCVDAFQRALHDTDETGRGRGTASRSFAASTWSRTRR